MLLEAIQKVASQGASVNGAANSDATVDTPEVSSISFNRHVALQQVREFTTCMLAVTGLDVACQEDSRELGKGCLGEEQVPASLPPPV